MNNCNNYNNWKTRAQSFDPEMMAKLRAEVARQKQLSSFSLDDQFLHCFYKQKTHHIVGNFKVGQRESVLQSFKDCYEFYLSYFRRGLFDFDSEMQTVFIYHNFIKTLKDTSLRENVFQEFKFASFDAPQSFEEKLKSVEMFEQYRINFELQNESVILSFVKLVTKTLFF